MRYLNNKEGVAEKRRKTDRGNLTAHVKHTSNPVPFLTKTCSQNSKMQEQITPFLSRCMYLTAS